MKDYEIKKSGLRVEVKNNNVTKALGKLKRLIQQEGITQELRKRQYYEKPSERRKREKSQGRMRWLKRQEELNKF